MIAPIALAITQTAENGGYWAIRNAVDEAELRKEHNKAYRNILRWVIERRKKAN
jgi:hypothetical protein